MLINAALAAEKMYFRRRSNINYLLRHGDGGIYMTPRTAPGKEKTPVDHNSASLCNLIRKV
jgi:hypothetical protein